MSNKHLVTATARGTFVHRWPHHVGAVLGLVIAACFLALAAGRDRRLPPSGPVLSESSGHLRELVIHFEPSARPIVAPVYRQFLSALEDDITVYAVCPDQPAFENLLATIGKCRCRIRPIIVHHQMTTWSRDRWLAFAPADRAGPATLWTPRGEAAGEIWPTRAGDERVAGDIATTLRGKVVARRSNLYFDAGDFLADDQSVFVIPRVLRRNLQQTVATREELLHTISTELKRRVILLDEAPDHHAGMFMASVGQGVMLVADPALGRDLCPAFWNNLSSANQDGDLWRPDFTPETQRLFDAVADQCAAAGYNVIRIPTVPGLDGKAYLTYVNVLMDRQDARRIVYLPFYQGAAQLNLAARQVWESLGYEVRPVDCTSTYRHFGCLHCLVNVLRRS